MTPDETTSPRDDVAGSTAAETAEASADGAVEAGSPAITADQRILDIDALRGLAHPLRIQLLEILGSLGPHTASGLAALTGESSGATSYHLRQLERHGFIQELPDKGTARERWWGSKPGGFAMPAASLAESSPANREAVSLVSRGFVQAQHRHLLAHLDRSTSDAAGSWFEASTVTTVNLRVTEDDLVEISAELNDAAQRIVDRYRDGKDRPGTRPIQMNLNAFPLSLPEETS
ncbi:Bacterial regulatory protein, arsR family [Sanguibacter keddieii DSM 10542]|uniref:Bacterial regulatory protein, arsR family n=1 Tax=Sanguibacter keddieii (strain ATCC 51767 / DSM 10542 / NCFB 3025 / ST-74) TaxID=446469 RepID=D1BBX7_SANKS|nr:helix-turn-helix domain-containing protein [Sanguibacter keddieii]ACZ20757.1 Bacterial regulatory protein, arsR family [Sanguibacter keddieii DSM 10542]